MEQFYLQLQQLQPGDRVVVSKSLLGLIRHHAIYLGYYNGNYWIIENKDGYGVRVVTADEFFRGVDRITRTEVFIPRYNYSREDLKAFTLSKVGTPYHLTGYNCESFANEVQHRVVKSRQSDIGVFLGIAAGTYLTLEILSSLTTNRRYASKR